MEFYGDDPEHIDWMLELSRDSSRKAPEMIANEPDFSGAPWTKSSYSSPENKGECVEVASVPGQVAIRDSKQRGAGPMLTFGTTEWALFLTATGAQER